MPLAERGATARSVLHAMIGVGLILATGALRSRAQTPEPDRQGNQEPVDLAADRVVTWTEGQIHWVELRGHSAIFQGAEGLRGDRAIVRVLPASATGARATVADAYVETDPPLNRGGKRLPAQRSTIHLESAAGVALKPYEKKNLTRLKGPPEDLSLLHRGFPDSGRSSASSSPDHRSSGPAAAEADASGTIERSKGGAPLRVAEAALRSEQAIVAPGEDPPAIGPGLSTMSAPRRDPSVIPAGMDEDDKIPDSLLQDLPNAPASPIAPAVAAPPNGGRALPPLRGAGAPGAAPGRSGAGLNPGVVIDDRNAEPPDPELLGPVVDPDFVEVAPKFPGLQKEINLYPIDSDGFTTRQLEPADGYSRVVIRGGVNIVVNRGAAPKNDKNALEAQKAQAEARKAEVDRALKEGRIPRQPPKEDPHYGTIDITADNAVIWYKDEKKEDGEEGATASPLAGKLQEIYLEGNVVVRQDDRKIAGTPDQRTLRAKRLYFNAVTNRMIALDAEANLFAQGLVAPMRVLAPRIDQFENGEKAPDGTPLKTIRADHTVSTGSRFADPGYKFKSRYLEIDQYPVPATSPDGKRIENADGSDRYTLKSYLDARQNVFYMGDAPVFFWPYQSATEDDLSPPLIGISPGYINYFGQYLLTDWNGYRLFNSIFPWLRLTRPNEVDVWNIDIDELSTRGVALGTNIGYFGGKIDKNLPFGYKLADNLPFEYLGYFKAWGLQDHGLDDLGTGPAVITYGPPGLGKRGFQRGDVPLATSSRGMMTFRHMQSLIDNKLNVEDMLGVDSVLPFPSLFDAPVDPLEDFRAQIDFGLISDRNFQEQYYQNEFDTGRDQSTDLYMIRQKENRAATLLVEGNIQNWYTATQSLPKLDYYRLGDSLLSDWFTYFQHTGADYAAVHTAIEVNNPNLFAFMPYDPVSNTSGLFQSGRAYTSHEIDMPINLKYLRLVPYAQGQFVGWNNQIGGESMARIWGAVGARADILVWKKYGYVESDLFNVHGLNHKINFYADFRDAFSNQNLNQIGIQDTIDDNTYEFVRRYFALTNYAGGLLPMQYDPRFLLLRRMTSPITGTTDIQGTIEGARLGVHQRLQTKRGPIGRRRVIDWMELDLSTTYFPDASRDNFGKPFGQNMYSWEWFVGDRTSIVSYGWFEFFNISGKPLLKTNPNHGNNPFGLNVITTGINITRPPKGQVFLGYTVIDTGPINTSALNVSYSYWMSPKWYSTFGTTYDFGNGVSLGSLLSFTRIGSDFLTTLGFTIDPQRGATQFGLQIVPRISPNVSNGASNSMGGLDTRYAKFD